MPRSTGRHAQDFSGNLCSQSSRKCAVNNCVFHSAEPQDVMMLMTTRLVKLKKFVCFPVIMETEYSFSIFYSMLVAK